MDGILGTLTAGKFLAPVIMALLSSCHPAIVESERSWLSFRCPDGPTVMALFEVGDRFVNVRFAGHEFRLPHLISGSGARYSDGRTTLWNKGDSVFVEVDDKIVVHDCMLEREPRG